MQVSDSKIYRETPSAQFADVTVGLGAHGHIRWSPAPEEPRPRRSMVTTSVFGASSESNEDKLSPTCCQSVRREAKVHNSRMYVSLSPGAYLNTCTPEAPPPFSMCNT